MKEMKKNGIRKRNIGPRGDFGSFLSGLGIGWGITYLLDPDVGPRRRAVLRDKLLSSSHALSDLIEKAGRDVLHRSQGLVAKTRSSLDKSEVDDHVLVERVRSELGRHVSHPRSIQVRAQDGHVILSGPILEHECDGLLAAVGKIRGVKDCFNQMDLHKTAENIPGLQGESSYPRQRRRFADGNWPPATRVVFGGAGAWLASSGLRRGGFFGTLFMLAGSSLLARAITNAPAKRLIGVGAGARAIDFHKTIFVQAPIEEVFSFWTKLENFPRFMDHVREIRVIDDRCSHWKVIGPAGLSVEWDAEITRLEPNKLFCWKTMPGTTVEHEGAIHFEEVNGGTRLDIQMTYNPPAGALGHTIASLFRKDPKHAMDDDLVRMKSLLEEGKATAHHSKVTMEELRQP
jgi:uncharacterized membrane protein